MNSDFVWQYLDQLHKNLVILIYKLENLRLALLRDIPVKCIWKQKDGGLNASFVIQVFCHFFAVGLLVQ